MSACYDVYREFDRVDEYRKSRDALPSVPIAATREQLRQYWQSPAMGRAFAVAPEAVSSRFLALDVGARDPLRGTPFIFLATREHDGTFDVTLGVGSSRGASDESRVSRIYVEAGGPDEREDIEGAKRARVAISDLVDRFEAEREGLRRRLWKALNEDVQVQRAARLSPTTVSVVLALPGRVQVLERGADAETDGIIESLTTLRRTVNERVAEVLGQ